MFFIFICALLFISCDKQPADYVSGRPSPVLEIGRNDKEIEKITENARRALPVFFRNLARPEAGAGSFFVKYPLTASGDDGGGDAPNGATEQVWLGGIRFKDGRYYGVLANNTAGPSAGKKKGDTIVFDPDMITDWMYVQNGKIAGGRSIKYLLEKIPEDERSAEQRKILRMFD